MKRMRFLLLATVAFAAACGAEDIAQPVLDDIDPAFAKNNQRSQCRASVVAPGANQGTVSADDCVFPGDHGNQYEDLYLVNQGRLGTRDGNQMATFALETEDFDWIFGFGGFVGKEIFPTPVYAFRSGPAGVYSAPWPGGPFPEFNFNTFSVIGGEPVYKMWVGGQSEEQVGDYTLTVSANPVSNTCAEAHRVYLQGDVSFSSSISDDNACEGVAVEGPFPGTLLSLQYWWVRMSAGETITLELDEIDGNTVAAAIFGPGGFDVDVGDGSGDTDRSVTFTTPIRADIYVEVSVVRGNTASYTATVDAPDTR